MKQRGFTLMELMVAILLGSVVMLMIAGSFRAAIRSWETVQVRVGENYNRRSVLDLLRRQSASLFFKADVEELNRAGGAARRPNRARQVAESRRVVKDATGRVINNDTDPGRRGRGGGFELPEGSHFFRGNLQELNFLSTVSFLSDFPGQVAVRYYIVQGDPGEDMALWELPNSRASASNFGSSANEEDLDYSPWEADAVEELVGDLYLYMEEKNLFLSNTLGEDIPSGALFPEETEEAGQVDAAEGGPRSDSITDQPETMAEVTATNTMKLLGPLRHFNIRYRNPGVTEAEEADEEEDWSEVWDVNRDGGYPTAIEFTLFYESDDPDVALEDLDRIRMIIPVYDTRNLARGGNRAPF